MNKEDKIIDIENRVENLELINKGIEYPELYKYCLRNNMDYFSINYRIDDPKIQYKF